MFNYADFDVINKIIQLIYMLMMNKIAKNTIFRLLNKTKAHQINRSLIFKLFIFYLSFS